MSSEASTSQDLSQVDPYQKCLNLAERIISSLDDKEVVKRYFDLKSKAKDAPQKTDAGPASIDSDKAYSFYESVTEENERLKEEISRLSAQQPDFSGSPENETIAAQIRELQHKILPSHTLTPSNDAVQELDSLKKIVDAKIDSLNFVRDKLKAENQRLSSEYKELSASLSSKIATAKEKEEAERAEAEKREMEQREELATAQRELDELKQKYQAAVEENEKLKQKHSDTASLLENISKETSEMDSQIEQMEKESESLFGEIEQLRTQLAVKSKELSSLQTLQKYGVQNEGEVKISEEIERLTQKAESLRAENAQMEFELKRLEKREKEAPASSISASLDEDELAAQILRGKLK